jgi:hypothetical protein
VSARKRDGIDAAMAHREVVRRANGTDLGARDLRVLNAVISVTASWGRVGDRLSLGQVADIAYGLLPHEAKPWQRKKTRESLAKLEAEGLIERRPPAPGERGGGRYWIALVPDLTDPARSENVRADPAEGSAPDPAVGSPPETSRPRRGVTEGPAVGSGVTPPQGHQRPRRGVTPDPDFGPPTEKYSEEPPEEAAEEVRRGTAPTSSDTVDVARLARREAPPTADPDTRAADLARHVVAAHLTPDHSATLERLLHDHKPGEALAELLDNLDDELAADEIHTDPIAWAIIIREHRPHLDVLRICDATSRQTSEPWRNHLDESLALARHWHREHHAGTGTPISYDPTSCEHAHADADARGGIARPAHLDRLAHDRMDPYLAHDLPRFNPGPARPTRERSTK